MEIPKATGQLALPYPWDSAGDISKCAIACYSSEDCTKFVVFKDICYWKKGSAAAHNGYSYMVDCYIKRVLPVCKKRLGRLNNSIRYDCSDKSCKIPTFWKNTYCDCKIPTDCKRKEEVKPIAIPRASYTLLGTGFCRGPGGNINSIYRSRRHVSDSACKDMCSSLESCPGYSYGPFCEVYGSMIKAPSRWRYSSHSTKTISGRSGTLGYSCYKKQKEGTRRA